METPTRTPTFTPVKQDLHYLQGKLEALKHENRTVHMANQQLLSDRLAFERRMWLVISAMMLMILTLAGALLWSLPLEQWGWK